MSDRQHILGFLRDRKNRAETGRPILESNVNRAWIYCYNVCSTSILASATPHGGWRQTSTWFKIKCCAIPTEWRTRLHSQKTVVQTIYWHAYHQMKCENSMKLGAVVACIIYFRNIERKTTVGLYLKPIHTMSRIARQALRSFDAEICRQGARNGWESRGKSWTSEVLNVI